ncbi:12449_t:CDS:2 [Entrophospora sp. SA101]|nr:12449_t:CDS:2 [Entrophospora sp. SA101]
MPSTTPTTTTNLIQTHSLENENVKKTLEEQTTYLQQLNSKIEEVKLEIEELKFDCETLENENIIIDNERKECEKNASEVLSKANDKHLQNLCKNIGFNNDIL